MVKYIFLLFFIFLSCFNYDFNNKLENGPIITSIKINNSYNNYLLQKNNSFNIIGENIYEYRVAQTTKEIIYLMNWKKFTEEVKITNDEGIYTIFFQFRDAIYHESSIFSLTYEIDLFYEYSPKKIADFSYDYIQFLSDNNNILYMNSNNIYNFNFETSKSKQLTYNNKAESAYYDNNFKYIYYIYEDKIKKLDSINNTEEIIYKGGIIKYITQIFRVNDYFYFNIPVNYIDMKAGFYKTDIEFKNFELLVKGHCQDIKYENNKFYYIKERTPYIYDILKKTYYNLNITCVKFSILNDNTIIYETAEHKLYLYNLNTQTRTRIAKQSYMHYLSYNKNFLIFKSDRTDNQGNYILDLTQFTTN